MKQPSHGGEDLLHFLFLAVAFVGIVFFGLRPGERAESSRPEPQTAWDGLSHNQRVVDQGISFFGRWMTHDAVLDVVNPDLGLAKKATELVTSKPTGPSLLIKR